MADAPICHIPGTEIIEQPSGGRIPNVPAATDLPSALRAIKVLSDIVRMLSGQLATANQGRVPNFNGRDGRDGVRGGDNTDRPGFGISQPPQWAEESRVEKLVKIPIGDSPDDFVEIKRIESLVMIDKGRNRWSWSRNR